MKRQKINDPIYHTSVTVYYDCTDEEFTRLTKKYDEALTTGKGAWMSIPGSRNSIIVIRKGVGTDRFLHELVHHAAWVFHISGIKITHEDDEPFAYYLAFLASRFKPIQCRLK